MIESAVEGLGVELQAGAVEAEAASAGGVGDGGLAAEAVVGVSDVRRVRIFVIDRKEFAGGGTVTVSRVEAAGGFPGSNIEFRIHFCRRTLLACHPQELEPPASKWPA